MDAPARQRLMASRSPARSFTAHRIGLLDRAHAPDPFETVESGWNPSEGSRDPLPSALRTIEFSEAKVLREPSCTLQAARSCFPSCTAPSVLATTLQFGAGSLSI